MSRKANCWDNATQESFFGHIKDEIDISWCTTFDEIQQSITKWTRYYNDERYQWDLAKLAPKEYHQYLQQGCTHWQFQKQMAQINLQISAMHKNMNLIVK